MPPSCARLAQRRPTGSGRPGARTGPSSSAADACPGTRCTTLGSAPAATQLADQVSERRSDPRPEGQPTRPSAARADRASEPRRRRDRRSRRTTRPVAQTSGTGHPDGHGPQSAAAPVGDRERHQRTQGRQVATHRRGRQPRAHQPPTQCSTCAWVIDTSGRLPNRGAMWCSQVDRSASWAFRLTASSTPPNAARSKPSHSASTRVEPLARPQLARLVLLSRHGIVLAAHT